MVAEMLFILDTSLNSLENDDSKCVETYCFVQQNSCLIALKKGILNFQNFDSYQASLLNSFENINIIIYGTLEIQGGCLNSKIALM